MIYEKLQQARVELQSKQLKKSGKNNYSGFQYYELADFLPEINKIFLDLKIGSNFSITETTATLTIIDCEDSSTAVFTSPVEELDLKGCNKVQALGGVHTYLKRYLYMNALEIVEADMFDKVAGREVEPEIKKVIPIKKEVVKHGEIDDIDIINGVEALDSLEACDIYWNSNAGKCSGSIARKQLVEALDKKREVLKQ